MASNSNADDKSDAAKTLDSLDVGDVIRLPKFYKNALRVTETTAIGIRVEFVDESLAARGSSKDLIRSKFTGEYGLVAGSTDKGGVWTVEVVTRRDADADEDGDADDDDPELLTDGGEDRVPIREGEDLTEAVDGEIIHDLARSFGMGAGGLKGLLRLPAPDRWDSNERGAVEAAVLEAATREDMTRDAFLLSVYGDDEDADDANARTDGGAVAEEDLVEVTVQFEKPVTAEDLRERFQDLADAAAGEDDAGDDETPRTDGGDPVANAEAFEDLLADVVERAVREGVHPSDASAILFREANDLAASMWSPNRDDADIIP